jgi:hypothetical protein
MHSLPFLFKFVVKSRLLFAALNGGKGTEPFEAGLEKTRAFKKKTKPSGFFGGFLGFLKYICPEERVFRVFSFSRILLGASRL